MFRLKDVDWVLCTLAFLILFLISWAVFRSEEIQSREAWVFYCSLDGCFCTDPRDVCEASYDRKIPLPR